MDSQLISNLKHHLKLIAGVNTFSDALEYALLPPGKLFRPKLAINISLDLISDIFLDRTHIDRSLKNPSSGLSLVCSFLEYHHAYTLIHDDLPCMDDDDYRRGKPSLHKKFSESTAVLAGDALMLGSLELLSMIESLKVSDLRIICKLLGAKGLIYGQVLDMNAQADQALSLTLEIHYLKTAKLLQAALLLPLLSYKRLTLQHFYKLLRLGKELGIIFQLLDDLAEIGESEITAHEKLINPWLNHSINCHQRFELAFLRLKNILVSMPNTKEFCEDYLIQCRHKIAKNQKKFNENLDMLEIKILDLKPVMILLNSL